jgi:hypothetical protein
MIVLLEKFRLRVQRFGTVRLDALQVWKEAVWASLASLGYPLECSEPKRMAATHPAFGSCAERRGCTDCLHVVHGVLLLLSKLEALRLSKAAMDRPIETVISWSQKRPL